MWGSSLGGSPGQIDPYWLSLGSLCIAVASIYINELRAISEQL